MAQERNQIQSQYIWNIEDLFATPADWDKGLEELKELSKSVVAFKGKIKTGDPDVMKEYFAFNDKLGLLAAKLGTYAHMVVDQDLRVAENNERQQRLQLFFVEYSQISAFETPEMGQISDEQLDILSKDPRTADHWMSFDQLKREKKHILSDVEEELMAKTSILGDVPDGAYSILTDAEMPWPQMKLESGEEIKLDHAEYMNQRVSKNRTDRDNAFHAFWKTYKQFEGTFGELMAGNIRQSVFNITVRKYASVLESCLENKNIPVSVYDSLVENVNKALPTFHRYLNLRKRMLGVDQLEYWDVYAPVVSDIDLKYTYEEAQQLVLEAIKPLGEEYAKVVKRAFDERWIDVYPNEGKASGAYSTGAAYDVHPYILTNFNGTLDSVSTLIHELGHTMHSYLSNTNQPYHKSHYAIFVAEVASTFNECLLDELMLKKLQKKEEKISLLMNILDGFKGTLFRQTQFAEFEREMYKLGESNQPITGKKLTQLYLDILKKYYGHDKGVCHIDELVGIEWAFIPHFYRAYYVYQYSTSFIASNALVEAVLKGGAEDQKRYLKFLSSGCAEYPIDLLRNAGIDMMEAKPFEYVMEKMNRIMDEIEKLLA
ncbi:MAG: oligoendopeptidase F [Bacteroidales bacterium]|nr:oligoendopeptidase F [Bacteroidales bacterium]